MAKFTNFKTDINELSQTYKKYMVSRVIDNPLNSLLELEIPTEIPNYFTVEMQFYSLVDNRLMQTMVYTSEDENLFTAKTFTYADNTTRKLLYMDFSRLNLMLEDMEGRFQIVLNFFVPEIGSYDEPQLMVTNISPSRTEIQLSLKPELDTAGNVNRLVNFASPQISSIWAKEAMKFICNQPNTTDSQIPTDTTKLTFNIVKEFLPIDVQSVLYGPNTPTTLVNNVTSSTQQILNSTYNNAAALIDARIATNPTASFTDEVLMEIFSSSLSNAYRNYPQTLQYTLL